MLIFNILPQLHGRRGPQRTTHLLLLILTGARSRSARLNQRHISLDFWRETGQSWSRRVSKYLVESSPSVSSTGPYSVDLDGTVTSTFDAFSADAVWTALYDSSTLRDSPHTVTITNQLNDTTRPFLDIDYITWTSTLPENSQTKTVEDTGGQFSYQPSASWTTDLASSLLTGSNNGHVTLTPGASAILTFSGDYVTVFGLAILRERRWEVCGHVQCDQAGLHRVGSLVSRRQISEPAVAGQVFAVDYAQPQPHSPSSVGQSVVGAAVGGVIAAIAALALIVFLLWFIRRQKRRAWETNDITLDDKHCPPAGAGNFTVLNSANASIPNHVGGAPSAVGSEPMLGYLCDDQSQSSRPPALANPWPSGRRAFHTVNDDPFSGSGSDTESSLRSFVFTSGAAGSGAPPPLPPTVNVPLPPGAERMYVPGREQDFGPLPPDYDQATEPYRPYRSR
ncbi:hypothetical protein B0H10DRAFT_2435870 [Mycena sp. CBHHK59/15]|nr:hypothetical protein B0H10DRAFT_2435870 [Mycena sp. CBHHK59/15]